MIVGSSPRYPQFVNFSDDDLFQLKDTVTSLTPITWAGLSERPVTLMTRLRQEIDIELEQRMREELDELGGPGPLV